MSSALRALRRRRASTLPAAEVALIRRRAWVGLLSGIATVAGLELYVVDFSAVMPGWWLALVGGLAGVAGVALIAVAARHAERSLFEGVQRGLFEGFAAATGYALLGRAIGALRKPE
jgi:hypothetical protein